MKKIAFCLSALVVGLPAFAAPMSPKPADIKLGDTGIKMTPLLSTKVSVDNNMFGTYSGKISATILELKPSAKFFLETGKDKYTGTFSLPSKFYLATSDIKNATPVQKKGMDDLDHTDWDFSGNVHKEFNSRNRLDVDFGFGHTTEDRSSAATAASLDLNSYDKTSGKATYGFGVQDARFHSDAYVKVENKAYDKANNISKNEKNADSTAVGLIGYLQLAPKTDALLELRTTSLTYSDTNPKKKSDFDLLTVLAGAKWDASEKLKGTVKVGYQNNDTAEHCKSGTGPGTVTACNLIGKDSISRPTWEITGTWKPQTYSTVTLDTSKTFGLEAQGEEFAVSTIMSASWKYEINDRVTSNLKFTNTKEDVLNGNGDDTIGHITNAVEAKATYVFQRWCKFDVGINNSSKDFDLVKGGKAAGQTDKFTKNVVFVAAELSL